MDRQPRPVIHAQTAGGIKRGKRAQHQPVGEQQDGCRNAEGETQRETKYSDLGVVGEQEACEEVQPLHRGSGLVVQYVAKLGRRAGRAAAAGQSLRDEGVEPVRIADREDMSDRRAQQQQCGGEQDRPQGVAHRGRIVMGEKSPQAGCKARPPAIDAEIGSHSQALEVEHDVPVQRDAARHGKRRQGRAIQNRQAQQFVRRQGRQAAFARALNEEVELPPGLFAVAPEVVAFQLWIGHMPVPRCFIRSTAISN